MIRIGTAGFSYKDWQGPVYPSPTPKDKLAYFAQFFDCIEMNVTFYRVPTAEQVAKWVASVAHHDTFRFTFKLYRGLTHDTEDASLAPFLDALAPCRDAGRLGGLLLQFPFFFRNTRDNRARLAQLARGIEGWPAAVEVRDRGWLTPPALDFIGRLGLSFCNIDLPQAKDSVPPGSFRTGPLGYVRLHGRNADAWFDKKAGRDQKYDYLYSDQELQTWVTHINEIAAETDSTYVVTNNHFGGQAVANAFMLARHLTDGADAPPTPPPQLQRHFPELL